MGTIESTTSEEKIQELLPGDRTTLLAIDGAPTLHVQRELGGMLDGATHAVLSVGGNDAVQEIEVLDHPSQTVAGALSEMQSAFVFRLCEPSSDQTAGSPPVTKCDKL